MSSDSDPVASIAKGTAEAFLEWTSEKLDSLITKFSNKDLAFIEDNETIQVAKDLRNTGEFAFFKKYVENKELNVLFQLGLTLRKLDNEKKDVTILQNKIKKKYDNKGLHIAYFVQNGLFTKYVAIMLEQVNTLDKLKLEIGAIFEGIDNKVSFIYNEAKDDFCDIKAEEIITKINAHSPKVFIISASGKAMKDCQKIKDIVVSRIINYEIEEYKAPVEQKNIYFLKKKN